jgi:hypothetical protein
MYHLRADGMSEVPPSTFWWERADDRYFRRKSWNELADADLYALRVTTCDRIAKLIIDSVNDDHYLFTDLLLKRSFPSRTKLTADTQSWRMEVPAILFPRLNSR